MSNFTFEFATKATIVGLTTNADGTSYVTFADGPCAALDIANNTGVAIEYRRNGGGLALPIFQGQTRRIVGITNASQIGVRRVDLNVAQVVVQAETLLV